MDPCNEVLFDVWEGDSQEGEKIADITRLGRGCQTNTFMNNHADLYGINFPASMPWKMKAMLMNACVYLDFMMFEEHGENSGGG